MNHKQLLDDLAQTKEIVLKEVCLGSPWYELRRRNKEKTKKILIPIADLVKIRPSYTRFCVDIYEVKANRSDFLSDIRSKKWEKYLPHCHRFYFAVQTGVCEKSEMPDGVGLYVRGDKGWACAKGAKPRNIELDTFMLLSLLFYKQKPANREKFNTWQTGKSKAAEKKLKEIGFQYSEYFRFMKNKGKTDWF